MITGEGFEILSAEYEFFLKRKPLTWGEDCCGWMRLQKLSGTVEKCIPYGAYQRKHNTPGLPNFCPNCGAGKDYSCQ